MSADRETNQTMTDRDIALLLADAADEVEIGIAPYQAVIRGGRRRRARRWALATATALVIAGTSGTLALAGLRDGSGVEVSPAVTQGSTAPATPQERHVYAPQQTLLGTGSVGGKEWRITVDEWGAPHDEGEARIQFQAMRTYGEVPVEVSKPSQLVGKSSFFTRRSIGDGAPAALTENTIGANDAMRGTDLESAALSLDPKHTMPQRLVIGQVARTAQEVTCTWKDGSSTVVHRVPAGADVNSDESAIRTVAGSSTNWFVCVGPEGTTFESVKVTG
ncbi:hypothetical protein JHN63_50215 [Streptomyces sp. MBT65]|uniref:hypothetical protein n=1 Tax=Streptomyces sp. MBT65 TaxID=1488395 RepID=UPI001909AFB6|nr:hypothetical protein [Streptomyces sp. MBT65]MBK3581793.1 hypothetical protein [Streptomyces sp. MBT65]